MRFRTLLSLSLFSLALVGGLPAQVQTPQQANLPWNGYKPQRIPSGFVSIVGQTGTVSLFTGDDATAQWTLPFPIFFIDRTYTTAWVCTNGWIGFNSTTSTLRFPNVSPGTAPPSRAIYAYWTDLYPAVTAGFGVFYRVDGAAPNRVLTVEWRGTNFAGRPGAGNAPPGSAQVKLFEDRTIEWHFSAQNIPVNDPAWRTVIGMKDAGQPLLDPPEDPAASDAGKYLLFVDPEAQAAPAAITRLRTGTVAGTNYTPEWQSSYFTPPGPYFHLNFPTYQGQRVSFRAARTFRDVRTESVTFTPTTAGNGYSEGDNVTINATFANVGDLPTSNVPVRADVYRNGTTLVASRTGTVSPNSATASITFGPSVGSPITDVAARYQVRVYPTLSGDEDASNDTLYGDFYIIRQNDAAVASILSPIPDAAPLFNQYPSGTEVPVEARFQNMGRLAQTNVPAGYTIYRSDGTVVGTGSSVIPGTWQSLQIRDVQLPSWTPQVPGDYYIKVWVALGTDQEHSNDTIPGYPSFGLRFEVRYETEIAAGAAATNPHAPGSGQSYPIGRPVKVAATFINSGISDATNVPVTVVIRNQNNVAVYSQTLQVLNITANGGATTQAFPEYTPTIDGQYCVTATANYGQDPVTANNQTTWCFNVKPALSGTIRVGFGERYHTIQEARDSLYYYGVGGPLTFELVDDSYLVEQTEPTVPALDFRGGVVGLSAANPVVWKAAAGKTDITINVKSASGIGFWFGQNDTSNPNGYMTFDGGAGHALHFIYENTTAGSNIAVPFFFGQGASNYTVKNVRIDPIAGGGRLAATTIPMPTYTASFNQFTFSPDLNIRTSAGIMLRNSVTDMTGRLTRPDTLRNQNNTFDNNVIGNFAYGIVSVGTGPLFYLQNASYQEYMNQNNSYTNNTIQNVSRGGIVVAFEKGSTISGNLIRNVSNGSAVPGAYGVWITSGGGTGNRAYSTDLKVERNSISSIVASTGEAAGIGVTTAENVFVSPTNAIYRFPANGATNIRVQNNMLWNYLGTSVTAGVAFTPDPQSRLDFVTSGNRIENNTLYNQIAGVSAEYGILALRSGATIANNIIALTSQTTRPIGIVLNVPDAAGVVQSDYNLFWIPEGSVGQLSKLSSSGYSIPSPPIASTLNQWRTLTGLDMNSVNGNITTEFINIDPASINLHINPNVNGSLVNNRGGRIADIATDIDGDPRGSAATSGRFDIGADEFNGIVRNYDLMAEDVVAPAGYRRTAGEFSDAEYVMVGSGPVPIRATVRNVGGFPLLQNTVRLQIDRWNGSGWTVVNAGISVPTSVDVSSSKQLDFGTFTPRTLGQLGQNDPIYGTNPNVTPLYRFRVTTGTDDHADNNSFDKIVRFYVQRSDRQVLVAVKNLGNMMPGDAAGKSNKLNTDTILSALNQINWSRADGVGAEDYDLFERDRWPAEDLNFTPWGTVIWGQGEDPQGLLPEERAALKAQLVAGNSIRRANLIIAGQEVARLHDVALTSSNGLVADQDFVRNYLHAQYGSNTNPANYSGLKIRGVRITPGKFEMLAPTGVTGDTDPMPSALKLVQGPGLVSATHSYRDEAAGTDTTAGVVATGSVSNSVYYAFDWRHAGRFQFEPTTSGARRLVLGALDYIDQFKGILPVKLASFDAYQSGRQSVTVEWKTTSETDLSGLEVERAVVNRTETGVVIGDYRVIEHKVPTGSATSGASYNVVDQGVETGREYSYRLVSVSLEGVRTPASEAKQVMVGGTTHQQYSLGVAPNPVVSSGSVSYVVPAGESVRVVLYDAVGRQVSVLSEQASGSGSVMLPVSDLASGVYTVRLEGSSGTVMTEKVSVQK